MAARTPLDKYSTPKGKFPQNLSGRILSGVLTVVLVFSSSPMLPALAEELSSGNNEPPQTAVLHEEAIDVLAVPIEEGGEQDAIDDSGSQEDDHAFLTTSVSVKVVWDNVDDEQISLSKTTVLLFANGDKTNKSVLLDGTKDENESTAWESDAWVASFSELAEYDGHDGSSEGAPIEYLVKADADELAKDGLSVEYYVVDEGGEQSPRGGRCARRWHSPNHKRCSKRRGEL